MSENRNRYGDRTCDVGHRPPTEKHPWLIFIEKVIQSEFILWYPVSYVSPESIRHSRYRQVKSSSSVAGMHFSQRNPVQSSGSGRVQSLQRFFLRFASTLRPDHC